MKLFISFNHINLSDAISCAQKIEETSDAFSIGPVLLLNHGIRAVETFRKRFPQKDILCDCRISDHENDLIKIIETSNCQWITVSAATHPHIIKSACSHARSHGIKVALDLIGNIESGQQALDAQELGVNALLFHLIGQNGSQENINERWELIRDNTELPVFITTGISKQNIHEVLRLKPDAIFVGGAVTESADPTTEAAYFYRLSTLTR